MALSPEDSHERFTRQARWTRDLRHHIYNRSRLAEAGRVLEVGSGTGVLLAELLDNSRAEVFGLDLHREGLELAARNAPDARLVQGDGHELPFPAASFDLSLCHFLLLWVASPVQLTAEMARVTRPGGAVLALAEPDYGGRIDHPAELEALGRLQAESLRRQGADPNLGRRLGEVFRSTNLIEVEVGVLGGRWVAPPPEDEWSSEWITLEADLAGEFEFAELEKLREIDRRAWIEGRRMLFVPTFYAWGQVPKKKSN